MENSPTPPSSPNPSPNPTSNSSLNPASSQPPILTPGAENQAQPQPNYPQYSQYSQYPQYPQYSQHPNYPQYPQYPQQTGQPGRFGQPQSGYAQPTYPGQPGYAPPQYGAQRPVASQPGWYTPPASVSPIFAPPAAAPAAKPTRRRPGAIFWLVAGLCLIPLIACAVVGAAAAAQQPSLLGGIPFISMRVSGTIYGQKASEVESGHAVAAPVIGAAVNCAGASATTDASGAYSLSMARGKAYTCTISAPNYSTASVTIHPNSAGSYTLNLGAANATTNGGACQSVSGALRCGALTLQPGSISGVALDSDNQQPYANVKVTCWDNSAAAQASAKNPQSYSTFTDSSGHYTIANAAVGPYLCVAGETGTTQAVVAHPGATATLDFSVCVNHCVGVSNHGGDVMHANTVYMIFWLPSGYHLEPGGGDANVESLVAQFVKDVGGTAFYGMLSQYWDDNGPVHNDVKLGGVYVDTRAYPHSGAQGDAISDDEVAAEIERVSQLKNWPVAPGVSYGLIAGHGVNTCFTYEGQASCSYPTANDGGFCAYHSSKSYSRADSTQNYIPYMLMADVSGCDRLQYGGYSNAPYGDALADSLINSMSHEMFEMVTDTTQQGWYDSSDYSEIGDKCETTFGAPIRGDGSTVQLAHGDTYLLQSEWSQTEGSCTYA